MAAYALSLGLASQTHAEILGSGWPYRRQVTVKQAAADAPGENVAWVEFYGHAAHKADGSDIRVTDNNRRILPSRVLQVSADDDLIRVAFATVSDGTYSVWWGNANPPKPAPELQIKRGMLMAVYRFPGGPAASEAALRRAVEKADQAKGPVGSVFLHDLALGHNPLGDEYSMLTHTRGQFKIDRPGSIDFAFTASDCGFLMIDGQLVAQQYNHQGLAGRVRQPKAVDLKAGWHTLEVMQANTRASWMGGMVVGWRRPGDRGFSTMPASVFAPVARATEGALEVPGKNYAADFSISPEGEAFAPPNHYLQRYVFEVRTPTGWTPTASWDFGDGQTSTLLKAHHYFLTPGVYNVTVKITQAGTTHTGTRRITIKDRMYQRFPRPPEDGAKTTQAVLATYDPKKLAGEQALRGAMFLQHHGDKDGYIAWAHAWLNAKEDTPYRSYQDETYEVSKLHLLRKEYPPAAEVFRLAASHQIDMEIRTQLMRVYAMMLCDYLDDPAKAYDALQEWLRKLPAEKRSLQHTTLAAMAYVAIAKGDGKTAAATVQEAGLRREQPYDKQQLQQGVLTRDVETYIRTRDFDTAEKLLLRWELDYPPALIDGFTRLLRVKLLTAQERPLIAARLAVAHAKALPNSFYAAELLYRASNCFTAAGEADKAKAALELLKSKYPESPYANEAGKKE